MAETTWAKVLQAVYETEDSGWRTTLAERTELSDDAVEDGLEFLDRHGLVTDVDEPVLTEKGFDVARQREMQRAQFEMNLFLAVFTFILSLAIVLQAVYQLRTLGVIGWLVGSTLLAGTFGVFYLLEKRSRITRLVLDGR
ncbi:MAG: hypothetical protein SV186_01625 [Candidatus Nanohaloarchaea archaeon]|nr:hypothetical protein [Candidatus Nanohaloarchaea archaeon]